MNHSSRLLCALLSLALVISLVPTSNFATSQLAHAAGPGIICNDDKAQNGRANCSFELGAAGQSNPLLAKASGAVSYRWYVDDPEVVSVSSVGTQRTVVTPGTKEGSTDLHVVVTYSDGSTEHDWAAYSVWRPVERSAAVTTRKATFTVTGTPGNADDGYATVKDAPAGTKVEVVGSCGSKWRVEFPAGAGVSFETGHDNEPSYVDKASVRVPVAGVRIEAVNPVSLNTGAELQLSAAASPSIADEKKISWSSSKKLVATVSSSGELKAKRAGRTRITATCGGKSAHVDIDVSASPAPVLYTDPHVVSASGKQGKLTWTGVAGASSYRVQIFYNGAWRAALETAGLSCSLASFAYGSKRKKLSKGKTYKVRVLPVSGGSVLGSAGAARNACMVRMGTAQFAASIRGKRGFRAKLKLKKDIYSFINSNSDFNSGTNRKYKHYYITDADANKLIDRAVEARACTRRRAEAMVENYASRESWNGSCFGMSSTVALYRTKKVDVFKRAMSGFVERRYSSWGLGKLSAPKKNTTLLSTINYYHMIQSFLPMQMVLNGSKRDAKKLVDRAKKGDSAIFCFYFSGGGHAVLLTGKHRKIKHGQVLYYYDPNNRKTNNKLYINSANGVVSFGTKSYSGMTSWAAIYDYGLFDPYKLI